MNGADIKGRYVDYDAYMAMRRDLMTLVLRLIGEDENTFSPETNEVMNRYRKEADDIICCSMDRFLRR